jgi:phosphopantetheinyl transferase
MQAVESQTLILYHTDLRDHWPEEGARQLATRLPYLKRLSVGSGTDAARASLAGIALALRTLAALLGRPVSAAEIVFAQHEKPLLAAGGVLDFSIAHSGALVGCAAVRGARVGFDLEQGVDERLNDWVAREATVKAAGLGMRAVSEVNLFAGGALCRGTRWYGHALQTFPGATAWLMTSIEGACVQVRSLGLAELFS